MSSNTIPAVIVYERAGRPHARATSRPSRRDAAEFGTLDTLDGEVIGPIPSEDGEAAQIIVPLDLGSDGWNLAADAVDDLRATAEDGPDGLDVYVTGPAGSAADSSAGVRGHRRHAAVRGRRRRHRHPADHLPQPDPLAPAGHLRGRRAHRLAGASIYLLADNYDLTVNAQSAGILTVLVFGAGTDYALLLVARYREELRKHGDRHEAMALALHRASPAIIASGATVAIGMLCLLFATMNSTAGLGPVAAVGVGVAVLVMLTLLPALLVTCGRWIFWPRAPKLGDDEPSEHGFWARVGGRIERRPRATWIGTSAILARRVPRHRRAQRDRPDHRGVVPRHPAVDRGREGARRALPRRRRHAGRGHRERATQADRRRRRSSPTSRASTRRASPSPSCKDGLAYLEGTLTSAPDSDDAYDTVDRVRDAVHAVPDADALVGGTTAVNLDVQRASADDNRLIIPIVLLVVFLILMVLLRAVVAPLVLIGTVVLSFGAAIGVSALVFKYVFGYAGADTSFPLFVFVFLVALGIDYNIFLMTRVREEAVRIGHHRGSLVGLAATGGVITSAGLVLAGTFAVLGTLPLVAFAEIGFAVAFGVLLDTLVVRSVLVTALNLDIGKAMWWPSALSKQAEPEPAEEKVPVPVA